MIRKWIDKIPPFFRNKYFLAILVFLVVMVFIDRNNMISQFRLKRQLRDLKQQEQFYITETRRDSAELQKLMTDSLEMERLGREKYLMKRDSEDIFIITRKPAEK